MKKQYLHTQQGLSLVEIMIAMVISVFLMAGIIQIFISSQKTYRIQEGLSRVQENGRFAMEFMARDIRKAGFQGCANLSRIAPNVIIDPQSPNPNPAPASLDSLTGVSIAVTGTDSIADDWSASACGVSDECIAGTDAITINIGNQCGGGLTGNMATNNANIQIKNPNACGVSAYDILLISDCSSADIFIATNVSLSGSDKQTIAHANNQNTTVNLSKIYGPDAELFVFQNISFFIREGASGQPSLWKLDNGKATSGSNPVELVEGIEDMQITYGEDIGGDGTPDYYVSEGDVVDMDRVVSVRVNLLARSITDNLTSQPIPYDFNNATTTPTDNRLRKVFTSTYSLRNRLD